MNNSRSGGAFSSQRGVICPFILNFIYSEKAMKFCKISTLLLYYVVQVKSKVDISQNFEAFSEYMNFTRDLSSNCRQIPTVPILFRVIYPIQDRFLLTSNYCLVKYKRIFSKFECQMLYPMTVESYC